MEIFKFDKQDILRHIEYDLKTFDNSKEPLNYVIKRLMKDKHSMTIKSLDKIDLNKIKENEGKNYYWSVINYKNITLVIRRYGYHFTIFTKITEMCDYRNKLKSTYGAFTFYSDLDKITNDGEFEISDSYYDEPFKDLNLVIKNLLVLLEESGVYLVWNSAALPRPKHVEIKLIFSGNRIDSIDLFVFCMEELEYIYVSLFSENTMVQLLKELKTGYKLNDRYKVGEIRTELIDDYYHGIGINMVDTMSDNKESFKDVYCLTRYYFDDLVKNMYIFEGEIYKEGGEFKGGKPVGYKNKEFGVTLFQKTFPKENFIPLVKY